MKEDYNSIGAAETEDQKNEFQLSDMISWTLCHKKFFAISIVICVALGLIYAQRAQRIYQRSASVMLRSDNKGQAQISELAAFADLGIGSTGIDVYNELQAFQSPLLMQDVVNQLRLNVTYKSKNWIGYVTDWYDKAPICVEYKNLPDHVGEQPLNSVTFVAEKEGQSQLTVKDFKINGIKSDAPAQTVKLGQPFKTPVGTVVLKATKEYGKNFEQAVIVGYERPELTAKSCQARLTAELADKLATVINFSYTDASEKRAEDVLNTLLDAYNEEWIRYTNKSTDNTAKFIDERLMSIERELGNVDSDIERFKSSNRLLDMNAETAQVTQESSKYSEQAFLANNQLAVARFIREYLVDNTRQYDLLPSNSGVGSQAIEEQIAEYNKKLLERQRLVANSSDSNPLVSDINNQLRMMRSTILRSVDNHISALKIQADRLSAQENAIENRISAGPGKAKELLTIERQQKIKEELYLYLLQKREENELQASIVVNNTRLLKPATGDSVPVSPKKGIILAAAFILGLAIPYGYMFASNMLNTKVRSRKDLEGMEVPVLGDVPLADGAKKLSLMSRLMKKENESETPHIVVEDHNRNVINEAYRVVRTNLDFMIGANKSEAIMATSLYPGSGKTFTSVNLATAMALKNKKVIVVDFDIRKGTFSKIVNSPSTGVCAYLNGQVSLDDIILPSKTTKLLFDSIPTGHLAPNPAELLLSDRLQAMIDELKQRYDYVFVDCPPITMVTDASLIAPHVDRTIFIARAGLIDRRTLPEIDEIYKENRYKNMCLLLNGSDESGTYTRYGYGYVYGYGYGYGNDTKKQ